MQPFDRTALSSTEQGADPSAIYGEGFAAVYKTSRYAVFSQRLAKLAVALIARHGSPGRDLLDLACGAGAGTVVLARAGFNVSATDGSAVMIRCTAERAQAHEIDVCLQHQDMRDIALPYRVDIVTCLFDALNYILREEELERVFSGVAQMLRQDGLFIFDMNTPHGLATRWGTKDIVATNRADIFEVNQNRYDTKVCTNTTTTTVFVREPEIDASETSGVFRRYTEVHRERGYPIETITTLLSDAGLKVLSIEELADSFQGMAGGLSPLTEDASRIVVAARRL